MDIKYFYEGPRRVIFGQNSANKVGAEVLLLGASRAIVVIDPDVLATGGAEIIFESLAKANIKIIIFDKITREPEPEEADQATELARNFNAEIVIGIGGGSAMDLAKATAVLVTNKGQAIDYIGLDLVKNAGIPSIILPTTAGTGSEVTFTAVFTQRLRRLKGGINSRLLYPYTVILDPLLTVSCPAYITAIVGMDALTHAIEAYISRSANPISDFNALTAVGFISDNLSQAVAHGRNIVAREGMLLGSHLAGISLAQAGVGVVHAMAYSLGAFYNIPHGEANATLLPFILDYGFNIYYKRLANIAYALSNLPEGLTIREAAKVCVSSIRSLSIDIGIPQRLSELGVSYSDIPSMAVRAISLDRLIINSPWQVKLTDLEDIYYSSF